MAALDALRRKVGLDWRWLALVSLVALLTILAAPLLGERAWLLVLAPPALAVVVACWLDPRITLLLLVVTVSLIYWFTSDLLILPDQAKFLKEALIALLFARALVSVLIRQRWLMMPLEKWLLLFVLLGLLSGIVNQVRPLVIAVALRGLFQYVLVFYSIVILRHRFDRGFCRLLVLVGLGMALLQLPIGLAQIYLGVRNGTLSEDTFRGTVGLSGANNVGLFVLPALFFVLSWLIDQRRWKLTTMGLALGLALVPVLSSSRLAWVCVALAFALLWWRKLLLSPRLLIFLGLVVAVGAVVLVRSVALNGEVATEQGRAWNRLDSLVSPQGVLTSLTTPGYGIGVVPWAQLVYRRLGDDAPVPLLGLGPGAGGSSAAVQLDTPSYRRYFYDYFNQARLGLPAHLQTQVLQTTAEYGPFGVLLLFAMLFEFYRIGWRARRVRGDGFLMALGTALLAQVVLMAVVSFKDGVWEQQMVALWLWLLGGLVYIGGGVPARGGDDGRA